jgi:hypothetical protein
MGGGTKGANEAPGARFTVMPGATPNAFQFDASSSTDADGGALEYWWNFGDGSDPIQGRLVEYEYPVSDTKFAVSLVVRDVRGLSGVALHEVSLGTGRNAGPEPQVDDANRWVRPGQTVGPSDPQHLHPRVKELAATAAAGRRAPSWIEFDAARLQARVLALPARQEIDVPVQEQLIVEYYSR